MVVIKSTIRPERKSKSAQRSIFNERLVLLRMAIKESKQLLMKMTIAKAAPLSINDDSLRLDILTEVNTMKQNPNKLAEVFKMCGDLFPCSSFINQFLQT